MTLEEYLKQKNAEATKTRNASQLDNELNVAKQKLSYSSNTSNKTNTDKTNKISSKTANQTSKLNTTIPSLKKKNSLLNKTSDKEVENALKQNGLIGNNTSVTKNTTALTQNSKDLTTYNPSSKLGYVAKQFGSGVLTGLTGLAQAGTTEVANAMKKGEEKSVASTILDFGTEIVKSSSPTYFAEKVAKTAVNNAKSIDKNKSVLENAVQYGLNSVSSSKNTIPGYSIAEKGLNLAGKITKQGDNVLKANEAISKPAENLQNKLQLESMNYGTGTKLIGQATNVVGNMTPSIATAILTKNPQASLTTMGLSAKGQATQEALKMGANLDQAVKIGDTKGAIEYGTEMLTGGINIFGKGAVDEIVEKGILNKVKDDLTRKMLSKGYEITGEVAEELISDVLGTIIDKGTVNPEATYTLSDFGETATVTMLSTLMLNALGLGGSVANQRNILPETKQNLLPENTQEQNNKQYNIQTQNQTTENMKPEQTYYQAPEAKNEIEKATFDSASKVMNNTQASRDLVDTVIKLGNKSNTTYIFANNNSKEIKQQKYNIINDLIKNGMTKEEAVKKANNIDIEGFALGNNKIVLNMDSQRAINRIMGHETTHIAENSDVYDKLQQTLFDYVKTTGKYQEYEDNAKAMYEQLGLDEKSIQKEMTAEMMADYAFSDKEFVNRLVKEDRTLVEKFLDKIKEIVGYFKANDKEQYKRWLEIEKLYSEALSSNKGTTETKYSLNEDTILNSIYKNVDNRTSKDNQKNNKRIEEFLKSEYPDYKIDFTNFKFDGTVKINSIEKISDYNERIEKIKENNEQYKDKIKKENEKNAYKTTPINQEDYFDFEYGVRPDENQIFQMQDIRNKVNNLVDNLKNDGYDLIFDESKSSSDAMYITVYENDEYKDTIRIANHFKSGVSGNHKFNIDLSEYNSKQGLLKDIEQTIKDVSNSKIQYSIQGLENYTKEEIKDISKDHIQNVLNDNYLDDVEIVGLDIHGSRNRRTAKNNSDLDVVVEYKGDIREDSLFDILNEEPLVIDGITVDINPITADKTGTLEEYMKRSNEYDKEVLNRKYSLSDIKEKYKDDLKYLILAEKEDSIALNNIVVKEELRNKGIGQKVLNEIIDYANNSNKIITLTPTTEFGTKEKLKKWYKKNGFVENKGKNTDFLISDTMYKRPDIRYSINSKGEMVDSDNKKVVLNATEVNPNFKNTLMAIHNLTIDKLKGILELGGFPVPIIAITNPNLINHSAFGDISVIFDKETINPENKLNEVYDRDVWSPTFPEVDYEINTDNVEDIANKIGIQDWKLQDYAENSKRPSDLAYQLSKKDEIIDKFIEDNNLNVETKYKESELTKWYNKQDSIKKFIIDNKLSLDKLRSDEELKNKYFEALRNEFNMDSDEIADIEKQIEFINDLLYTNSIRLGSLGKDFDILNSGVTKTVDEYATKIEKRKVAEENGLLNYLENEVKSLFGDKGIYNGKEYLTPSGKRRTFWQLHDEYNLENVVEQLTKDDTKGTQKWVAGYGQIQAQMARKFKSITDIKSSQNQLTSLEEKNEILEDAQNRVKEDIDNIVAKNDTDISTVSELLADFAKGNLTISNFRKLIDKWYQTTKNVSDEDINKIIDDLNNLRDLPTDYFEAKPQRAIGFDEVKAIVVPNNIDSELLKDLEDRGINVIKYDTEIEGDRADKINALEQYKFSLSEKGQRKNDLRRSGDVFGSEVKYQEPKTEKEKSSLRNKAQQNINRNKRIFRDNIVKNLQTSVYSNKEILDGVLNDITEDIRKNGVVSQENSNKYFERLYSELKRTDEEFYNQYKDLKKEIRNTKLYVPSSVKNSITDYNQFRLSNMGKMTLTNNQTNTDIDTYYKELNSRYPNLFPDTVINAMDQLELISEVAKDITKTEENVSAYIDKNLGEDYKMWAKNDFENVLSQFTEKINFAYRYNDDVQAEEVEKEFNRDEVKSMYSSLKELRREYDKAMSKAMLTSEDTHQLDRVIAGDITLDELPDGVNKNEIRKVYQSKYQLRTIEKEIKKYKDKIAVEKLTKAQDSIGDLNEWKDKKIGLQYSRETAKRNFEDIAPKATAQRINEEYIQQYYSHEADVTRAVNDYTQRVNDLKLSTAKKYKVTYETQEIQGTQVVDVQKTEKVSEAELVQIFGEHRLDEKELEKSGANVTRIKNAVSTFQSIYSDVIEKVNDSLINNGYEPINIRKDYFPHYIQGEEMVTEKVSKMLGIDLSGEELPTELAGRTANFKPGKTYVANFNTRKTNISDFNVLKAFDTYIRKTMDVVYHTDDITDMRALSNAIRDFYTTEEIKAEIEKVKESTQSIEEKTADIEQIRERVRKNSNLSNFIQWFDNYINILAGKQTVEDRSMEKNLSRKSYQLMKNAESRIAANMVGINLNVAISNFGVLAQSLGELSPVELSKGMLGTLWASGKTAINKSDNSFASLSNFLTNRRGTNTTYQTMLDKITEPINNTLNLVDDFVTETIVRAKYMKNLENGMTQQEALNNADLYTSGLVGDRAKGSLPTAFSNKNPISKLLTMFQVEVNNQYSYMFKDLPRNTENKAKTVYGLTKMAIGSYIMNELMGRDLLPDPIRYVEDLIKGLGNDDDDDDWETISATAEKIAGVIPFMNVPSIILGSMFDIDTSNIGRIPISGAIPDVVKITKAGFTGDSEYLKETAKKELSKPLFNFFMPAGGAQLKKTYEGIKTMVDGASYTTNKQGEKQLQYTTGNLTIPDIIKTATLGKYSIPNAQTYKDNGYKSYTVKQTKLYEDSEIDYNTLNDLFSKQTEINTSKSKTKKYELASYINSMDITDDQKYEVYKYALISDNETDDGTSELSDVEYMLSHGVSKNEFMTEYTKAKEKGISLPDEEAYTKLRVNGLTLENYVDYKSLLKENKKEDENLKQADKINILRNSGFTNTVKEKLYTTYIKSKDDDNYEEYKSYVNNNTAINSFLDYKYQCETELTKQRNQGKKTEEQNLNSTDKINVIKNMNANTSQKEGLYLSYVASDSSKDIYNNLKKISGSNVINQYLNFVTSDTSSDKEDDGTKSGKTVTGSAKTKTQNVIENLTLSELSKIYLYGTKYDLTTKTEKSNYNKLVTYIDTLNPVEQTKIVKTLKGATEMKDGSYNY